MDSLNEIFVVSNSQLLSLYLFWTQRGAGLSCILEFREVGCIDSAERTKILFSIFVLCSNQRSNTAKTAISALSHSSNIEHILEIFAFGQLPSLEHQVVVVGGSLIQCLF